MEVISTNPCQIRILCAGTKIGLIEKRKEAWDEAKRLANSSHLAGYAEVSTKTG